jgi:Cof subfamily protein (haloacid dehalogenase superfamily)
MVVTDLDGTLLPATREFSHTDLNTLKWLGEQGIMCAIATGRSLFSAKGVLPPDFPIDYLIFSSGAGIMHWPTKTLLMTHKLEQSEIHQASGLLQAHELDFMIHHPIPENHRFLYYDTGRNTPDFLRRYRRYKEFAQPLKSDQPGLEAACQIVAIDPYRGDASRYRIIRQQLPTLKVIRSTSPLDGASTWIEIFPTTVSKALASEWVAGRHTIPIRNTLAIGNDYNDLDLLEWAGHSIVVSNAPSELTQTYQTVSSHNENGFTEAVSFWITNIAFTDINT